MANILVIEDQAELRVLYELMLQQVGHTVVTAKDGVDGLHRLKELPDLVILDLSMPVASGDVVLGFMRSTPELEKIPVLIISALPKAEKIAQQLGADACLQKPVNLDTITSTIDRLLAESSR